MTKAMLIDTSLCMACRGCQAVYKQWNQLPAEATTLRALMKIHLIFPGAPG